MNSRAGFTKHRHAERIGEIRPRQFHVVGQFVRRNPLENQLPGVGIFALVALQRHIQQTDADESY